jgi:hypothetical protein
VIDHDPHDLEQQEQAQEQRALRDQLLRESEESDLKWLMSSRRGRRIVWRLLDQAGVFRSTFNPNALVMSFSEGERNYGLRTLRLIHAHCHEQYGVMVKEQTKADDSRPESTS